MIEILYGYDLKKKNAYMKSVVGNVESIQISPRTISLNVLLSYSHQAPLFGDRPTIILENPISVSEMVFTDELLEVLKNSETNFIFLEDDLTAAEIKKYKKFSEIKEFTLIKPANKTNPFVVANAFGNKDKLGAWSAYCDVLARGEGPEAIAGMLFWKIKTLLIAPSQNPFTKIELKNASSALIDIYHKAHAGEMELDIGLEKFILDTL